MHPILFHIGSFPIGTYGVMIVIGMLAALWLAARLAARRGLRSEFFYDLTFILLISGFVGARLFSIIIESDHFWDHPVEFLFSRQGFVFQGGFIVALICGLIFTFRRRMPLLEVTDIIAPALALAHAFGRIGCFFAGCCFGFAVPPGTHNAVLRALAVQYPLVLENGRPSEMFNFAYGEQLQQHLIEPGANAPLPIVPTQLMESLGNFIICAILVWQWRRRRFSGQTFALYMILYAFLRFGLEFLRGDIDRGVYFNGLISTAQIICIFTLIGGISLWWYRRGKGFQPISAAARPEGYQAPETSESAKENKPAATPGRSARKRSRSAAN